MDLKDLKSQLQSYHNILAKTDTYREEWPATKELIHTSLSKIVKESGMQAKVATEENLQGMELVYLCFEKRESGIFERIGKIKRPYLKDGGYLTYTQIYNGKISVWMSQPSIEQLMENKAPDPIDIYEPTELNEGLIIHHVTHFLKEMIKWEDLDASHHQLGYNMNQKK